MLIKRKATRPSIVVSLTSTKLTAWHPWDIIRSRYHGMVLPPF